MTGQERFTACLAVSFLIHFLGAGWGSGTPEATELSQSIAVELRSSVGTAEGEGSTVGAATTGNGTLSEQESARKAYLKAVSDAVHARRLNDPAARQEIGTAWYRVMLYPDGRFSAPVLVRSSGHRGLDTSAEQAIRAASGVVRRPPLLGDETIEVTLPVKYQYGL